MQKSKKTPISITAVVKKMARRSFMVFLVLIFAFAVVALLMVFNYQPQDDSVSQSGAGVFGPSRAKEYQDVFSIIESRQAENDAVASTTYPEVFKELTE